MTPAPSWLAAAAAYAPTRRDRRPALVLDRTVIGGRSVRVTQRQLAETPFCRLMRLERNAGSDSDPRVLVVTPLSGHFTPLLADLLAGLAPAHDVHFTDWTDAREVPAAAGQFGVAENIDHVLGFIRHLGPPLHLLGLCQSAMPALAATALLAQQRDRALPRTLTLVNGMLDTRIAPTRIDRLARLRPLPWLERRAIAAVPAGYPGQGRLVYPAAYQHAGLMAYLARHVASGGELLAKALQDDGENAAAQPFLETFLSVMDLPAAFFLCTIDLVFQRCALPEHRLFWRGERVEPAAITTTALMTIEGEHDDVSAPGQTRAAHALCRNIPDQRRRHHLQAGVGHFGVFHGRVWRSEVLPRLAAFIREMA
jgi:poly(3-hydroxybutyrate) depolymerase